MWPPLPLHAWHGPSSPPSATRATWGERVMFGRENEAFKTVNTPVFSVSMVGWDPPLALFEIFLRHHLPHPRSKHIRRAKRAPRTKGRNTGTKARTNTHAPHAKPPTNHATQRGGHTHQGTREKDARAPTPCTHGTPQDATYAAAQRETPRVGPRQARPNTHVHASHVRAETGGQVISNTTARSTRITRPCLGARGRSRS